MSKSKNIRGSLVERKCDRCGKNFIPAPYHTYKSCKGLYCTYSCMVSAEKRYDEEFKARKSGRR